MDNPPPPRQRRWFQFHLLTVIIVIVEIGALIGLNVVPRTGGIRGWPENSVWWDEHSNHPYSIDDRRFILDLAIAYLIVATSAKFSEYLIRLRKARKPDVNESNI